MIHLRGYTRGNAQEVGSGVCVCYIWYYVATGVQVLERDLMFSASRSLPPAVIIFAVCHPLYLTPPITLCLPLTTVL